MFTLRWQRKRDQQPSRQRRRSPASAKTYRPRVEALEDRRLLSIFKVYNANDAGRGSLREAILDVNEDPGPNTIVFKIPGHTVHTIAPASPLPTIINPVTIDGTTQPGFQGTPLIQLAGPGASSGVNGLTLNAADSTVRGLAIFGFGNGLNLQAGAGNGRVAGNYLGLDASGAAAPGNGTGIVVTLTANVLIGGTDPADRNVISGNRIGIQTHVTPGITVQGNFIGTDATGTQPLGNVTAGMITDDRPGEAIQVGGTAPGAGNLISANGIGLDFEGGTCVVQGNRIGTDITGTLPLGNGTGIYAGTNGNGGNTFGGTDPGAGNLISGNGTGIATAQDVPRNVIQGNLIGTDITGTQPLGNGTGVLLGSVANLLGGTADGARNIISGNRNHGVFLDSDDADSNLVQGNYIGTDITGTQALGNGGYGINIRSHGGSGAIGNLIGGTAPGAGNVIANSGRDGIYSDGDRTVIQGNFIGTDVTGTVPMGNAGDGIEVGSNAVVGGVGAGNIISNNGGDGILHGFDRITIQGNLIGTDITGTVPMGNAGNGVRLSGRLATRAVVGGTNPGEGNVIAYNGNDGVLVEQQAQTDAILANSIHDSGRLGIELTSGGNNGQAFPDLTSATLANTGTVVTGMLTSTPNTTFTVEFFANDVCNPSGYGEGQYWLGDATVTTDDNGQASFTATVAASSPGQFIAATATDPMNDTSAFSGCVQVAAPSSIVGGVAPARPDRAPPVDMAPVSAGARRAVDSADSPSSAIPVRVAIGSPTAPVLSGAAIAPRPAETDWFWQALGRDPLAAS